MKQNLSRLINNKRTLKIRRRDVINASTEAVAALDESAFRVRFARPTPVEKKSLRAMADLGPGPHRFGDIAEERRRSVQSLGPTRAGLIAKGMIWSPTHGNTAVTGALFDEFMKRIMRGNEWKTIGNWCSASSSTCPLFPTEDRNRSDCKPRSCCLDRVYGMLSVGLALFGLRYIIPEKHWSDKAARISFWSLNLGLAWIVFAP